MKIMVFGVTHKNSSIGLREKVAYSRSKLQKAYEHLNGSAFVKEAVIISTCNRSEIFAVVEEIEKGVKWFRNFYQNFFQLQPQELEGHYIVKTGREAIEYLYEVCCGLDSLVLGEDQILGQVKEAHQKALDYSATGKILNRLFLEAVTVAKEIKTKTAISENPLSISSIAVKQMETSLGGLEGKSVLVVGYGEMSRIAMENLLEKGVDTIYICNRSSGAIEALEKKHPQIKFIPFEEKYTKINEIDAILSATAAPHYIFYYDEVKELYKGERHICMVDIALPRDIDPLIEDIEGITLYHIDHLKAVVEESLLYRQQCIEEMKEFIQKSVDKYIEWYRCIPIYPRIKALKNYSERMTEEELEGLFKKLSHIEEKDKELIEVVVKSLIKKMWKKPILQMKHAGVNGRGEQVVAVVDELFDLNTNTSNE